MTHSNTSGKKTSAGSLPLKKLTAEQVQQIDGLLASIGDYGEVHVIVQRGEVRYINRVESHKVWHEEKGENE